MDPLDFFAYEEFFNPGLTYECPACGTCFGIEAAAVDEPTGRQVVVCPGCGSQWAIGGDEDG